MSNARFIVYDRITGGEYLTPRVREAGYRWSKNRTNAKRFTTRATAERNARRYGGIVVCA
jgi:hypothetical protein